MYKHTRTMGLILDRSKVIGIPRYVVIPILTLVSLWLTSSGTEWTLNRLKSIKVDLIRKEAGYTSPVSKWIKRSKKRGNFFGGPFGILEDYMFSSKHKFFKGIQFLQMYTSFYSDEVTPQQEQKFLSSVNAEPTPHPTGIVYETVFRGLQLASEYSKLLSPRSGELQPAESLILMEPSPNKRAPTFSMNTVPEKDGIIDSLDFLFGSKAQYLHYVKYKDLYLSVLEGLEPLITFTFGSIAPSKITEFRVGKIGLIQEAGFKLRAVANPSRVFQRVLEPIGNYLYGILKDLPWDCTFDQNKAVEPLKAHFTSAKSAFCFDLSNATDLFPWYIQRVILDDLLPNSKYPQLFEDLSKGTWSYRNRTIVWKVGQPLGLYPSFASFALAHGIILLGLLDKPYNGEFYILGDDVVILDERLAESYHSFMVMIGCKISEPKSLASNKIGEFAGKLITSNNVVPMLKYRNPSDDSFIDIAKNLGPRSIWLFKPLQRQVLLEIAEVPEFLGGLGWNPKGLPLQDRLKDWIFADPKPVDRLTGHTKLMIRNYLNSRIYNSVCLKLESYGYSPSTILVKTSLEQRVQSLTYKMSRSLVPLSHLMGKNIDLVFGNSSNIPINSEFLAKRPTTLNSWLRRLGLHQPLSVR